MHPYFSTKIDYLQIQSLIPGNANDSQDIVQLVIGNLMAGISIIK